MDFDRPILLDVCGEGRSCALGLAGYLLLMVVGTGSCLHWCVITSRGLSAGAGGSSNASMLVPSAVHSANVGMLSAGTTRDG